jgi:hypothetical protein
MRPDLVAVDVACRFGLPELRRTIGYHKLSAERDKDHPRKAVVRAMIHRGGLVAATEGKSIRTSMNAPDRKDWVAVKPPDYPDEQEDA